MSSTDWNHLKLFSRDELLEMVPDRFEFKTDPWKHQISAFLANISNPGFLDALDLGTGKTKVSIDTVRYADDGRGKIKVLFLCLNTAVEKMRDEVITHSDLTASCLRGSKNEKWKLFGKSSNFYIINYEGLRTMVTKRVPAGLSPKGKPIKKEVIDEAALKGFASKEFDFIIVDESHIIKNHKSLIFKIIKLIGIPIKNRLLLTGTPFGNSLLDVWAQYYIIDQGETFGKSITHFKRNHFEDKGWMLNGRWIPVLKPTRNGEADIRSKLFTKAIRYKEEEVDDLPPKVFRTLEYSLSSAQRKAYTSLMNEDDDELTRDIGNKSIGFRTIASGFIKSSNHIFNDNPKLDVLWNLVDNVVEHHKIVIFTEFIQSRVLIEKLLKKKKVKFRSLSGATKDKYKEYNTFQTDPQYRVIVCNIKSGGASIDLIAATYCVYYELGGSVINHKQSLKRIHRGGQTERCYFYYLLGKATVEKSIYNDLQDGVDAFSRVADKDEMKKYLMGEVDG